jgi:hypothetical protein
MSRFFINLKYLGLLIFLAFLNFSCTEEDLLTTALEITESPLYDFGAIAANSTADQTFTITNSGVVAATNMSGLDLAAPYSYKGGTYPGTGGTCATSLDVGSTCDVVITFAPTSTGIFSEDLFIRYNNGSINRLLELALSGEGTGGGGGPAATLVISDGPVYDFGSVMTGNQTSKSFTVTNVGSATATALSGSGLAAPFTFFGGVYPGTGGTCGFTLATAASCTVVVNFSPVSVGIFADTINIDYNDSSASQVASRGIQGTGM